MPIYNQSTFRGGLSTRFDRLKTSLDSYPLLINGRVRDDVVEPVPKPLQDTLAPEGLYQNITAVGSILLLFVSGEAFYRDVSTTNGWRRVTGLALDPNVDTIDTADIPASTLNYKREGPIDNVKFNNSSARATEEGILATDGINQPALVYPQPGGIINARPTFTYAQWTETPTGELREYVPVGRFPIFVGQKLYMAILSPGGVLNRIAQSVSGRPLDFVIAINNTTGDKDGDALTTCHAVGFDPIVGLYKTGADEAFLVATGRNVIGVLPDFSNLNFFFEPALRNRPIFPSGVINNISAADLNGDSAFISPTGIHSFNATTNNKYASNNDPVSKQIHKLLAGAQTYGAAGEFDDYAFFSVETIFGPGVAVYDKTLPAGDSGALGRFVALDMYAGIGQIKQYAKVSTATGDRLFFITADNRLFEFGASDTRETCRYYLGDYNSASGRTVQTFRRAFLVFSDVYEEMIAQVTLFVDKQTIETVAYAPVPASETTAPTIPVPYKVTTGRAYAVVQYETNKTTLGMGSGAMIEWNSAAKLAFVSFEMEDEAPSPSILSQLGTYATRRTTPRVRYALVGDLDPGTVTAALMNLPSDYQIIGLGDFFYGSSPATDYAAYADSVQELIAQGRWHSVGGEVDFDHDAGLVYFNTFGNGKRYGSYVVGPIEFFFYNAGWTTATLGSGSTPIEPDGSAAGSVQAQWLQSALAASTATFKLVVVHEAPYSSGNFAPGYPTLRLSFRAWGATAVISAHDHNYQRYIVDGLNYFVCGTGGHSLMPLNATKGAGYQAGRASVNGFLRLETDQFNIASAHVGVDGTVFDKFTFHP